MIILLYKALYNNIDNIILFKKINIIYLIIILIYPLNKQKHNILYLIKMYNKYNNNN